MFYRRFVSDYVVFKSRFSHHRDVSVGRCSQFEIECNLQQRFCPG